ncbi:N-acetylmuramoyl-L-alanine amidase family protein [Bacillus salinus]|uniref:N-acetylmuramoyl-L-alanine amidase family protein n=1 Tax=Bacillus sp. HMF5848 TaxID=2495421 RepID=UPI00163AACB1|nr:N-acetylmuramoyl-L-alanine amidase [Bacillus sp. HMF5848]
MVFLRIFITTVIIIAFPTLASAEKLVIIDPGHGGKFYGTCGFSGVQTGYCEKDANLEVALLVRKYLQQDTNIRVELTRSDDREFAPILRGNEGEGDLAKRIQLANELAATNNQQTIFISIHHNAHPTNPFRRGVETYYFDGIQHANPTYPFDPLQLLFRDDSKRLAESVHPALVNQLATPDRRIHNNQSFFVIRNAQMPAILLELGYMSNRFEEQSIRAKTFQQTAAKAIAEGITSYFQVYEVYGANDRKLATFQHEIDALTYAKQTRSAIHVFDKDRQKVIYKVLDKITL